MTVSTIELARADQAARLLLEQLGLTAYLYEIEPRDGGWALRLDCAVSDGWQSFMFDIDKAKLLTSLEDESARAELLKSWRDRLAGCKIG